MESAPLTLAHTHARNAASETKRSNPVAASEEHDLAAAEFAAAAQTTSDTEALRILTLLEQHHKKLGQILRFTHEKPVQDNAVARSNTPQSDQTREETLFAGNSTQIQLTESTTHPPRLTRPGRSTARDLSSSIASNLASARGIPSSRQKRTVPISPLVSNQNADGQITSEGAVRQQHSRLNSDVVTAAVSTSRPSWTPPADVSENAIAPRERTAVDSTSKDAPFQQFYSTFESLITKLSAPLAFAGLPLVSQPSPKPEVEPPRPTPPEKQDSLQASTDYSQLISHAALRAVRNDNRAGVSNPAESFYVVPTSGGTVSYAEIMNRVEREESRQHRRNYSDISDDFVDASSRILPEQPQIRGARRGGQEQKVNGKTMEELALENTALKHLSDTLSKRLHVFEMSAQTSSAALAQSIRSLHLSPVSTPESSRGKQISRTGGDDSQRMARRIQELEEILKKSDARIKKRDEENVKLKDTVARYRDKWENLKAGAKARREAGRTGNTTGGADLPRRHATDFEGNSAGD